jgi:hypothetical protein
MQNQLSSLPCGAAFLRISSVEKWMTSRKQEGVGERWLFPFKKQFKEKKNTKPHSNQYTFSSHTKNTQLNEVYKMYYIQISTRH